MWLCIYKKTTTVCIWKKWRVTANISLNWTHAKMLDVQVIDNDQEDFVQIFADYLCDFSNKDTRKYIKSVESLWPAGPPEQYKQLIRDVLY